MISESEVNGMTYAVVTSISTGGPAEQVSIL